MDVGVPLFPLLRLPKDAQIDVLRNMNPIEQVGISLCSVKSKALIQSLKIKLRHSSITFGDTIRFFSSTNLNFHFQLDLFVDEAPNWNRERNQPPIKLPMPKLVDIGYFDTRGGTIHRWKKTGFTVRDWLFHILSIFNYSKIDEWCFKHNYDHIFDIESIRKTIDGLSVKSLKVRNARPNQAFEQIFETFRSAKKLTFYTNPLENRESIHKVLNENFEVVVFVSDFQEKLNDLLATNSREIRIFYSKLTGKYLNKFLKHWINGSNPRLKLFWIYFLTSSDVNVTDKTVVLKGIEHLMIPVEQERIIHTLDDNSDGFRTTRIKGGLDIQRKDGTHATIWLSNGVNCREFTMYVWS